MNPPVDSSVRPTVESKPILILDTNTLLYAIASSPTDGPDCNSPLDRQARTTANPEKIRGQIAQALAKGTVLVPEIVIQEITAKANSALMSPENRQRARSLLDALRPFIQPCLVPRIFFVRQKLLLDKCEAHANQYVAELRKNGHQIPDNWHHTPPHGHRTPEQKQLSAILYHSNNPSCLLWHKLASYKDRVYDNIHKLPIKRADTFERLFYKKAKDLDPILNDETLSPKEYERASRRQIRYEIAQQRSRLFTIPDFAITCTALMLEKRAPGKVSIMTYDKDFLTIGTLIPSLAVRTSPLLLEDPKVTFDGLIDKLKSTGKKQSSHTDDFGPLL